jgi:hypothetical protein
VETTKTLSCEEVGELVRRAALDHLQADVRRHEDMFLLALDWGEPELNEAAIAEWAWGLLERQRKAITEAVMRAFEEHDNDKENGR